MLDQPQLSTGALFRQDEESMQFLGTVFVFGSPRHFLTAAHCVGDLTPNRMAVLLPAGWSTVSSVEKHPSADLAVLTGSGNLAGLEPFKVYADRFAAEHYCALGYPEDSLTTGSTMPTFREFLCHIQRDLPYKSFAGYEYKAYELSIPAPRGLSGAPLFLRHLPFGVIGVIVENIDASTALEAMEEVDKEGVKRTIQYQRVISYGIAVAVHPFKEWLEEATGSASRPG